MVKSFHDQGDDVVKSFQEDEVVKTFHDQEDEVVKSFHDQKNVVVKSFHDQEDEVVQSFHDQVDDSEHLKLKLICSRNHYQLYEMTLQVEQFQPDMDTCGQCKDGISK